jgi:hypothetical protein
MNILNMYFEVGLLAEPYCAVLIGACVGLLMGVDSQVVLEVVPSREEGALASLVFTSAHSINSSSDLIVEF